MSSTAQSNPPRLQHGVWAGSVRRVRSVPHLLDQYSPLVGPPFEQGPASQGDMDHNVGIWIDHKKAVIVSASADRVSAKTLESDVGPHARYSGPQDAGAEKKYEERHGQQLDRYYDEAISQLGQPEAVLIFGPGEAKLQLQERLSRSKALAERIVGIETTDKLTDPQIVAKVKEHYGIDR
jgi:hypothetical protein